MIKRYSYDGFDKEVLTEGTVVKVLDNREEEQEKPGTVHYSHNYNKALGTRYYRRDSQNNSGVYLVNSCSDENLVLLNHKMEIVIVNFVEVGSRYELTILSE